MSAPQSDARPRLSGSVAPIAVVGVSALMPGSSDVDGFWRALALGVDAVAEVPRTHWLIKDHFDSDPKAVDKTYGRRGAFLDPISFEPLSFGVVSSNLDATDPAQLLTLIAARDLLDDVKGDNEHSNFDTERTGIVLGTSSVTQLAMLLYSRTQRPTWRRAMRECGLDEQQIESLCDRIAAQYVDFKESSFPGMLGNVVAGRVANRFDLGGMNCIVDAACASSLASVAVGMSELHLGNADAMLVGGIDILSDPMTFICFSKTPAMSPTGACRPFADDADGLILGEGIALFALRRLEDAERDGNVIYAVIRGLGSSSDGSHRSVFAPSDRGQVRALRRAYRAAGFGPDTVEFLEAHGTATRLGDQVEYQGLCEVFPSNDRQRYCAMGSIKSQFGHSKAAAGAASLLKLLLALDKKILPPTINVEQPNRRLDFDNSAFYLNTRLRPWIKSAGQPRRASASAFGFGGTNYHIVVEEYTGSAPRPRRAPVLPQRLLLACASSPEALCDRLRKYSAQLRGGGLSRLTQESIADFDPSASVRFCAVGEEPEALANLLEAAAQRPLDSAKAQGFQLPGWCAYNAQPPERGRVALLFPGQGSQHPDMGAHLACAFPASREIWDRLAGRTDLDGPELLRRVFPLPAFSADAEVAQVEALRETAFAQPAIAAANLAVLELVRKCALEFDLTAGHSSGELCALHAAGCFDADTLLGLARVRGLAMAQSPGVRGRMLAIAAAVDDCMRLVEDEACFVANENSPRQTVAAGAREGIKRLMWRCRERGISATELPVGGAFHTPMMTTAQAGLRAALEATSLAGPICDVHSNVGPSIYAEDGSNLVPTLLEQVVAPVRFARQVQAMYAAGARVFLEVGPGNALTSLVGETLDALPHLALAFQASGQDELTAFLRCIGNLSVRGVPLDLSWLATWVQPALRRPQPPGYAVMISSVPVGTVAPDAEPAPLSADPRSPGSQPSRNDAAMPAVQPMALAFDTTSVATSPVGDVTRLYADAALAHTEFLRTVSETHTRFLAFAEQLGHGAPLSPAWPEELGQTAGRKVEPVSPGDILYPHAVPSEESPDPTEGAAPPAVDADGVATLALEVVSEVTGYPRDLLDLGMEIEAGLGIDSIQRVEILTRLEARLPGGSDTEPEAIAGVRTVADIVSLSMQRLGADPVSVASGPDDGDSERGAEGHNLANAQTPSISRMIVTQDPAVAPGELTPRFEPGAKVAVITVDDESEALAEAIRAALEQFGLHVHRGKVGACDPLASIVLWPQSACDGISAVETASAAVERVGGLAQGWREAPEVTRSIVVVEAGNSPWSAGGWALAAVLAKEWPALRVRCIRWAERTRPKAAQLAMRLVQEITGGGAEPYVTLGEDGVRYRFRFKEEPVQVGNLPLSDGDLVVVSGGGRGITARAVLALAHERRCTFLLLGRTALGAPPTVVEGANTEMEIHRRLAASYRDEGREFKSLRLARESRTIMAAREVRATMKELARLGAPARYSCVDVRDIEALSTVILGARGEWGPVKGLIHGSGVLADARIEDKTEGMVRDVLGAKLLGLSNLLAVTRDDPLTLMCLFSSAVSYTGNEGQVDYAIANAVLNAVAHDEADSRAPHCLVKSLAWGPWRGGMVSPELGEDLERRGIALLSPHAGAGAFLAEISERPGTSVAPVVAARARS